MQKGDGGLYLGKIIGAGNEDKTEWRYAIIGIHEKPSFIFESDITHYFMGGSYFPVV